MPFFCTAVLPGPIQAYGWNGGCIQTLRDVEDTARNCDICLFEVKKYLHARIFEAVAGLERKDMIPSVLEGCKSRNSPDGVQCLLDGGNLVLRPRDDHEGGDGRKQFRGLSEHPH
jgi:hypothetical protein